MVPFSFLQTLLKSRVMQKYLTGAMDDGINGFLDNWVQRHAGWVHSVDHRPSRWSPSPEFKAVLKGFKGFKPI
jgi:hypothetical protein